MNRLDLLDAAARIENYAQGLNINANICTCCNLTKYEDFGQHQTKVELDAMVAKLRRFANHVRRDDQQEASRGN